jgi:hypothetical protein
VMFDRWRATPSTTSSAARWLHHDHRANFTRTFEEPHRVLKPGGRLLVINETLRSLLDPTLDPGKSVAEFEGHEHA